jgi:hypothetical protein
MSVKKNSKTNTPPTASTSSPALKIGSRVRCTDDGVEGRIIWANAVAVKIRWDDGEQVTWRRDSLAGRPIEILDPAGEDEQTAAPVACAPNAPLGLQQTDQEAATAAAEAAEGCASSEQPVAEPPAEPALAPAPTDQPVNVPSTEPTQMPQADAPGQTWAEEAKTEACRPWEAVGETSTLSEHAAGHPDAEPTAAKKPRTRKPKDAGEGKEKRLSALDAAAKVLAEAGQAMTCQELIAAMTDKGYWTSPGGKTPAATLYSAMLREITVKGSASRFVKTARGQFARTGAS